MGIACTSAGILGIFLIPETLGVSLPDTAQEARANKRYGLHTKYDITILYDYVVLGFIRGRREFEE